MHSAAWSRLWFRIFLIIFAPLWGPMEYGRIANQYVAFGFNLTLLVDDPGISRNDPRFIGAWWVGYLMVGTLLMICSLPMFFYPAQFKNAPVKTSVIKKKMKESGGQFSFEVFWIIKKTRFALQALVKHWSVSFTTHWFCCSCWATPLATQALLASIWCMPSTSSLSTDRPALPPVCSLVRHRSFQWGLEYSWEACSYRCANHGLVSFSPFSSWSNCAPYLA